jgi:TATA-binding protein-associated factor
MKDGAITWLQSSFVSLFSIALEILFQIRCVSLSVCLHFVLTAIQVVAPVRETVSQTLASLLLHMPLRSVGHVHSILLQMIRQDFALPSKATVGKKDDRNHVWEVRHAGLLGIKYEVAVRSDLFDAPKEEESGDAGKEILQGVVDAAVLGYFSSHGCRTLWITECCFRLGDRDDDVRAVAATCLLPVASHLVERLPESLDRVLAVLWGCLRDMKDDLSSSVGAVMDLLGTHDFSCTMDSSNCRQVSWSLTVKSSIY